ncbi:hypothetical protein PVAND_011000 [Polypedilum vanderplanki]|uniref:Odorant binding protein n=1 Tax=Polypedilum vanderplanki TaxID=319348 RepID=A0A9J6CI90_POLVA|nr:hypothetical protein PVAND_011000 [Polypedilum vanderplanki]
MKRYTKLAFLICNIVLFDFFLSKALAALTMAQFEQMMKTIRATCGAKYKLSDELIDGLKTGMFIDNNIELKSYVFCVAQMSGIMSKKNEISEQKILSQIENLLPVELKQNSIAVWNACKSKQQGIPDKLDRIFVLTKCFYDFNPEKFVFP